LLLAPLKYLDDRLLRVCCGQRTASAVCFRGRKPGTPEGGLIVCGFAGLLYADSTRPLERAVLAAMGDRIAHRGPDAEGFWSAPGIGLVHRRLSIIDLAGGDQPIANEDDSLQVVFNGEIYNYQGLRAGLEAKGHRFRTRSDTEVLVHLYEEHGEHLVERLRGMFTFALWDRPRRRLLLARDRLGIKPLYVYRDREKLLFASEPKAILAHPGLTADVDPAALEDYLAFGMVPGRRSIFRRIEKLPPAHVLVVTPDRLDAEPRRYWQLRVEPDESRTVEQWQEELRAKIDETVRLHLIADVPVGAFLSGGVDSSIVVASAAGRTEGPLQTFTIGFREESFSELPYARQVAEQFGTRHAEEVVTPDAVSLVDELTRYFDEPFADPSAVPTYLVSRLARRSVKVALSGDGGDEAFGGYARYAHDLKEASVRRWLPGWLRRGVLGPLARRWPRADWLPRALRAKTALTNLSLDDAGAYANTLALCRPPLRRRLLAADLAAGLNGHQPEATVRNGYGTAPPGDALAGMIAADVAVVLPDDFLVKVDRASMAHGLEVRPPFLDHELLQLAARIPSRWKVCRGETKWLLKEAYRERLPADALWRRKHGFDMPIDGWLRGPLREMFEDAVLAPQAAVGALINQATVRNLYQAHRAGTGRHGSVLWSVLVLARWADRYLRSEGARPHTGMVPTVQEEPRQQ
jgi:asparagine synthase (glutamine-hydrolysing)